MSRKILPLQLCLFFLCLALSGAAWAAAPVKIVIFYTSDTHGYVFSEKNLIGLDTLAALKKSEPGAILLDAGDFLNGEVAASFSQGEDVTRLMRLAGYDAATLGNHEFDHGTDVLLRRYAGASAPSALPALPLISANILTQDEAAGNWRFLVDTGAILYRKGVSIGILGLTTLDGESVAGPGGRGLLRKDAAYGSAELMIARLKAAGCDIVIGLSHLGNDGGYPESSLGLDGLAGLDAVIDGHSHKRRDLRLPKGLPLFSPGSGGKAVGRLEITYDKDAGRISRIHNALLSGADLKQKYPGLQADKTVAAALEALNQKMDAALSTPVGQMPFALEAGRKGLRTGPTPLGVFCAEAMRAAYGSDAALLNSGSIRGGLPQGQVTERHMLGLFPYGGSIAEFEISGAQLLEILEHGLRALPDPWGGYLQVAGLELEARPENPPGSRLAWARLAGGQAVEAKARYRVAVNDYMAKGGDGYRWFAGKTPLRRGIGMSNAVIAKMNAE